MKLTAIVTAKDRKPVDGDGTQAGGAHADPSSVKVIATTTTSAPGTPAEPLTSDEKVRVGVEAERRDPIVSNAPKSSVANALASQVQRSREELGLKKLAATLDPNEAVKTAKALGAGTFGAAYDLGNGFVLKHFGDPSSKVGQLVAAMPVETFIDGAKRQAAVHTALREAGFPCVAAQVIDGHPTWMIMQKAEGLRYDVLTDEELAQARAMCEALRASIGPVVNQALRGLGVDVGDGIDTDVHIDNARYARTAAGLVITAFFDPTF